MVRSNVHYYPVFKEINVYDNFYYIDNMSNYFSFTNGQYSDPYTNDVPDWTKISGNYLSLANKNIVLRGKITLPSVTEDGTPIIGIDNDTFSEQSEITHIFFQNKLKPEDITKKIESLTALMNVAVKSLDFEKAILLRDEIAELKAKQEGKSIQKEVKIEKVREKVYERTRKSSKAK
jgi:hypothetical protein